MAKRRELQPDLWAALDWLRKLEAGGGGYRRRGVRGWARREEAEAGAGVFLWERLPKLHRAGLVDRDDVRSPGRTRPLWLYRVTEAGVRVLARGQPYRPVAPPGPPDPDDGAVYLPDGARGALEALRLALMDPAPGMALPHERGWRTGSELTALLAAQPGGVGSRGFYSESLSWLVRAGLAERRTVTVAWRGQPVVVWRATPAGGVLQLIEWREPGTET